MKKGKIIFFFFLMFIVSFFTNCKKEDKGRAPQITLSEPVEYSSYNSYDTVHFVMSVESHELVNSLKINFLDESKNSIKQLLSIQPGKSSFAIDTLIILDVSNISSSSHYFFVQACNQSDCSNTYIKTRIYQDSEEFYSLACLYYIHSQKTGLKCLDENLNVYATYEYYTDYSGSDFSRGWNKIILSGRVNHGIKYINPLNGAITLEIDAVNNAPFPYYTNVVANDSTVFAPVYENKILGFSRTGLQSFNAVLPLNKYAEKVFVTENYVYSQQQNYQYNEKSLGVFYLSTAYMKKEIQTDSDIVGIYDMDNDKVIIFRNLNNKAGICSFHPSMNGLSQFYELNDCQWKDAARINKNEYLLTENNNLFLYKTGEYELNLLKSIPGIEKIAYESRGKTIYAVTQDSILSFHYPGLIVKNSLYLQDSILDIHLLYK